MSNHNQLPVLCLLFPPIIPVVFPHSQLVPLASVHGCTFYPSIASRYAGESESTFANKSFGPAASRLSCYAFPHASVCCSTCFLWSKCLLQTQLALPQLVPAVLDASPLSTLPPAGNSGWSQVVPLAQMPSCSGRFVTRCCSSSKFSC